MDDFILKITAEIVITQEDVDDIMSTALDSSMLQCWCSEVPFRRLYASCKTLRWNLGS